MNTTDLHAYVVNLLLHSALLSLVALAVASCFNNPHARSMSAALGLIALSVIPWISALQVPTENAVVAIPIAPKSNSKPLPALIITPPETGTVSVRETNPTPTAPPEFELPDPWTLLAGIWALGFAFQITRQSVAVIRLARWKSPLRHATGPELQTLHEHSPGLTNSCHVRISAAGTSPCVTGCFRPTLVLPENLLAPGQPRELSWALRHEAGHLRGHDLQWLALFQLILAVQWWNPFVHRLVRIWADAREQVCDHLAVAVPHERAEYGAFIVALGARRINGTVLAMADRGTVTRLKRRIRFLMEARPCHPCGRGFIAGGTLAAVLTGLCVAQLGVKAETPTPAPEPPHNAVEGKTVPNSDGTAPADTNPPSNIRIKISTKLFVTPTPLAPLPGDPLRDIHSEEQWQLLLRELAQKRDTILVTAPSISTEPRQKSMIEIIREGPDNDPAPIPANADPSTRQSRAIDDPDYQFTGIRMEFTTDFKGEQIDMNCRLAYGHIPGSDPGQLDKLDSTKIPWQKVRILRAESRALLKPTQSLLVHVGEIDPGRHLTLVVSVVPIDATGKPVGASEEPVDESGNELDETNSSNQQEPVYPRAIVVLEPPPTVRLKAQGWLLDADQNASHFDTWKKPDGKTILVGPYSKERAETILKSARGKTIGLPPVEFQSGKTEASLWKQIPDLSLKATAGPEGFVFDIAMTTALKPPGVQTSLTTYKGYYLAVNLPSAEPGKSKILLLCVDLVGN